MFVILCVPLLQSTAWGVIYSTSNPSVYINSTLISTSGTWNVSNPFVFQTDNKSASASFNYTVYDLTYLDLSEQNSFVIGNTLGTPAFSYNQTFMYVIDGYTFRDISLYNNGFYGLGASTNRTVETIFPNGIYYSYNLDSAFTDPLRFVLYSDTEGYYTAAWTVTPYPNNNLVVCDALCNEPASAFDINATNPQNITMEVSLSASNNGNSTFSIALNQVSLASGETSIYSLTTGTGFVGTSTNLLGAIENAFAGAVEYIASSITGFFGYLFSKGLYSILNSLGLGWILQVLSYFEGAFLVLFSIVTATLPYIGIILLIVNLLYVVQMDFAGLFSFWIQIYNVVAMIANFLIDVVNTIVDFIGSISGGGAGAGAIAAGA
jgi:hypothetical protein